MPEPVRARIIALSIVMLAAATALVGAFASMVAIMTDDAHPVLKVIVPTATVWLVATLVALVAKLKRAGNRADDWIDPLSALKEAPRRIPDASMRIAWPQATFYQEVPLPPDAGTHGLPWRQKVVTKITMSDNRNRYLVRWRGRSRAA